LVDAGLVSERDLVDALVEQGRSGRRLGEILVQRGTVSAPAVANALAEQHGSFLKTEHGFGTGLQTLPGGADREEPPVSPPALSVDQDYLVFVPTPQGYLLVTRSGKTPEAGDRVELDDSPDVRFFVTKVAASPLPGDERVCVYLQVF
jgi:hypothetical protein